MNSKSRYVCPDPMGTLPEFLDFTFVPSSFYRAGKHFLDKFLRPEVNKQKAKLVMYGVATVFEAARLGLYSLAALELSDKLF